MKKFILIIGFFFIIGKAQALPFSVMEFDIWYKKLFSSDLRIKTLSFSLITTFNFEKHSGLYLEASFPEYIHSIKIKNEKFGYVRPLINYKIGFEYCPSKDGFYLILGYNRLNYEKTSDSFLSGQPNIERMSSGGFFFSSGLYLDAKYTHIDIMAEVEFAGDAFISYKISFLKIRLFDK